MANCLAHVDGLLEAVCARPERSMAGAGDSFRGLGSWFVFNGNGRLDDASLGIWETPAAGWSACGPSRSNTRNRSRTARNRVQHGLRRGWLRFAQVLVRSADGRDLARNRSAPLKNGTNGFRQRSDGLLRRAEQVSPPPWIVLLGLCLSPGRCPGRGTAELLPDGLWYQGTGTDGGRPGSIVRFNSFTLA
jgi:hypothetical protein